jgi:diacylglycerol kinase family enzyme
MPPQSFKVIINARSGFSDKEESRKKLDEVFAGAGVTADISLAKDGDEIARLAKEAVRENWTVIVAGGGDGTVNCVASAVIGTEKILGVLPFGTLNHFAKDLGLPLDLEEAAGALILGRVIQVDAGEVNGRLFLNNSTLGLYPTIVHEREKKQRLGSGKWPAFIWAAVAAFRTYPFLGVQMVAKGKKYSLRTPFIFVGNNEYVMEGFNIGRREHLDKGQLSVYVTNRTGRWGLVRLAWRAMFRRLREEKDFLALVTDELRIKTRHKTLRVAFDGEVTRLAAPFHFRIRPRILRVMAPQREDR